MKEAITSLAEELGIKNIALLEQDVRLHRLLHHVTKKSIIADNLVFKGGPISPNVIWTIPDSAST